MGFQVDSRNVDNMTRKHVLMFGALCLIVCLMWAYPMLSLHLSDQHDIPTHLRWSDQFLTALREGNLMPRWAYASLNGLGDPTFVYYQPLFYYITSIAALFGLRPERALVVGAAVPYLLLGLVVYRQVFQRYTTRYAMLATFFIVAGPLVYFLSVQVGAFPWTLSLPFSILFAIESTRERPRIARLALLMCAICLSHLLSGLITLCCVALARLAFAFPNRSTLPGHVRWGAGVALGIALSAFFIYPAISQQHLINPAGWVDGEGVWRKAYVLPVFTVHLGLRWFAIQWPLGLAVAATIVLALWPIRGAQPTPANTLARRLSFMAVAAFIFSTEIVYPLYELLEPLRKIQYPYRFLFIAGLLANIALLIRLGEGAFARWGKPVRLAVVAVLLLQCALAAFLHLSLYRSGGLMPDRETFMSGRFGTAEYHPAVRGAEWKTYAENGKLPAECARLGIGCASIVHRSHDFSATIDTPRPVAVRLPLFAYPAWGVKVDGVPQPTVADKATGLILVELPPGRHVVTLAWVRMPSETVGIGISLAALFVLLGVLAWPRLRRRKTPVQPGTFSAEAVEPGPRTV